MARRTELVLSPTLHVPLEAITDTFGIFGQKGSGKSSTGATFVEQGVKVGGRFVIADPTGVWWGLMHDGAGPGLPGIVLGGEHADLPLEPTAGHVVAEFVVHQTQYPVVVLDMKLMRKAERVSFMLAFMETLYHENREALHVMIDESPQFAPTQAREGGDQIKLLGAVEDVVALGRARGLGITMIAQRFAMLNANVREQIGTLICHRLVGSLDRTALKKWIESNGDPANEKEALDSIAKLPTGTALVYSPAFLDYFGIVEVNTPTTFDSRATPKVGQRVKTPGRRAEVNLDLLRDRMAATIEEQADKDPKLLRERLAQAKALDEQRQREIREVNEAFKDLVGWTDRVMVEALNTGDSAVEEVLAVYMGIRNVTEVGFSTEVVDEVRALEENRPPMLTPQEMAQLKLFMEWWNGQAGDLSARLEELRGVLLPLAENVEQAIRPRPAIERERIPPPTPAPTRPPPKPSDALQSVTGTSLRVRREDSQHPTFPPPTDVGGLGAAALHLLTTLAQYHPMRVTIGQLGTLAGRKTRGGSFNAAMKELRAGYVQEGDGLIGPSEMGLALVGTAAGPPLSPEEVIEQWRSKLPTAAREVFDTVASSYPDPIAVDVVASLLGRAARGGSWNGALALLVQNRLIEKGAGGLRASDDLFVGRNR